ncbi:MerR family DNA-binding transcriptional regulator [Rhodobacteraceae bacterium LMO-12]|jgi:DNA-binding transcriptional MerR regulator|nr:MerR family DNA-binding transcriptional regulator [Rhodobacteraceae bacterium LMO-JJ12]
MPDTDETMTIRQMCDAFDVTPRTLRFYESKELLFPIREGQKRLFTKRDRARLKLILRGKRFGFSLEEIRQLLELYDIGDQQQTQLVRTFEIARERLNDMETQRDELNEAIADLREQLTWGEKVLASMTTEKSAAE